MYLSKNNRFPFFILVLAFVAYFASWSYANYHGLMPTDWSAWRGVLLVGFVLLIWIYFCALDEKFKISQILLILAVPFVIGIFLLISYSIIYCRLPDFNRMEIYYFYIIEALALFMGLFMAHVIKYYL